MVKITDFQLKKKKGEKISMVTCYDYSFARILNESDVDTLLVGDSLAMTMHGYTSTLPATVEMMALHTAAVVRGAPKKFIVGDMPFLSFRKDLNANMDAVAKIMQTGAHAVKLEGAKGNLDLVRHVVDSGVPVMGHLGLTPQSVHQLGGFKVQGKELEQQEEILKDALALEKAGCFSIVLECVPKALTQKISKELQIPTIGIGASSEADGQVLVLQDLLGMNMDFRPKFVRQYWKGAEQFKEIFNHFHRDVLGKEFPTNDESY